MEVVPRVIRRQQHIRLIRVSNHLVKVKYSVELSTLSNPFVDPLSRDLSVWIAVYLTRTSERRDRSAINGYAVPVKPIDHLIVRLDETITECLLRCLVCRSNTNVVDTVVYYSVSSTCMGYDVSVNAPKGIWAQTIGEQSISTCSLIDDGDVLGR